jgi:DNA-binding GntR family transcriptional regulator
MIRIDATPGGSWSFVSNETETEFMMAVTGGSKPSIHRIERQSLPETLAASLRERILNGEFKEGDPLVQETIAEEYEVSRMPVREALRQLEALGLIVMRTHKGAIVTSMQQAKVAELFDLRAVLECEILSRALPFFNRDCAKRSEDILLQLESAYHRRDVATWGGLNWQFHESLYLPANRPETLSIIEGINIQTDRFIRAQLLMSGAIANAELEHRELLRLCEERDIRAVEYLRLHIQNAGKMPPPQKAADAA